MPRWHGNHAQFFWQSIQNLVFFVWNQYSFEEHHFLQQGKPMHQEYVLPPMHKKCENLHQPRTTSSLLSMSHFKAFLALQGLVTNLTKVVLNKLNLCPQPNHKGISITQQPHMEVYFLSKCFFSSYCKHDLQLLMTDWKIS